MQASRTSAPPRARWLLALCLALVGAVGCGASVHFDGRRFEKERTAYQIGELPPGWQRVQVDEQDLAFAREGQGTISVHALCEQYEDVPHAVLLNHLLFGFTEREYLVEDEVVIDGRDAHHAIVDAELDGVPVRMEVYILTRNGCVYDLAYVSGRDAPAHERFGRFAQQFSIERARGE